MNAGSASATYRYPPTARRARVTRATLQHRRMRPTLVQYEAPGWGVGELWLDGERVLWSEHPRPRPGTSSGHVLARRLAAFFAGEPDDFADVELDVPDGFHGDCARVLREVPRGEVVTYGEL